MDKKPTTRPALAKAGGRALNTTFAGRVAPSAPQTTVKERKKASARGFNTTALSLDHTFAAPVSSGADKELEFKLEYNKLLQSVFMECMLDETQGREKTELDGMLAQLAERCERNVDLLDKTHTRLKEISFLSEKQRILDMMTAETSKFTEELATSTATNIMDKLTHKQQAYLDRVETRNVDLGYSTETGHKQLLEAMDETLHALKNIKMQSKLTTESLEEFTKLNENCHKVETQMKELDDLKTNFDENFPSLTEKAVLKSSEVLAKYIEDQLGVSDADE